MADKKIALDLEVNIKKGDMTLGELNKQLQDLGTNIQEQKDILIEFEKELLDLDKIQASTSKTELARQTELKDKQEELKVAIKDQRLAIRDLTNEQSKASGEVNAYNKELENTKKGLEKTADAQKNGSKASAIFSKGLKAVGTAFKALGIGAVLAALKFLFDALSQNQKVVNVFSTAMETISIVLGKVVDVFVGVVEQVAKSSNGFEGLKNVMLGLLRIAITPLQLAFYGIKLGIQEAQLIWEKSFFGSKDAKTITELTKGIEDTKDSISEVAKEAVKAGGQVADNIGKAINEVSQVVTASAEGISKISIKGAIEQAKANVAIKNSALLAAAQQGLLIEQYDRLAEKQRQIRDDESKSISERITANNELGKILEMQEKAMLSQADLQIAAARAELNKNNNIETQVALTEALANRAGVLAAVEGFRSEQKVNEIALNKELLEQNKAISQSEADLAYERQKFDAMQIEDKLKSLETLRDIEAERQRIEQERLQKIVDEAKAETQAKVDAQIALDQFKEASRQATLTAEAAVLAEITALNKKEEENAIALQQGKIDLALSTLNAVKSLTESFAREDEASQKKAFELSKAVSIGMSVISTYEAALAAFKTAQKSPLTAIFPAYPAVQAGLATAFGLAQVNNIRKSQFKGSSVSPTSPTTSSLGGGGAGVSPIGFTQTANSNETPMTKVIVTETDIRRATRNIDGIYNKAVVVE
jgi:hypothetical protein